MNKNDAALLSEATYIMGNKSGNRTKKYNEINELVKSTGYQVIPNYTNKNLVTYQKIDDPKTVAIAHQGTNVKSTTGFKDIVSDVGIALGLGDHLPHIRKRKRKTEQVLKDLNPDKFYLSGHSLGGYTANHTIANSKRVQKHLTNAHTFNAAQNPILSNDLQVSDKVKKQLDDKVVHHRVHGDLVSAGFKKSLPFGKLQNYKLKDEHKNERAGERILSKMLSFNPALKTIRNYTKKAIDSHHIDHFHQDRLTKVDKNTKNVSQEDEKIEEGEN